MDAQTPADTPQDDREQEQPALPRDDTTEETDIETLLTEGEAEDSEAPTEATEGLDPEGKVEELRNDLLRLQAEYVNYRKRVERDRTLAREQATVEVMLSLLPVLDDIEAARTHGDLTEGPFASIATKLETALTAYGLERIEGTGETFDPTIHEALLQQPSAEVTSDTVSQVLRAGYRRGERVLRAAQVAVAVPE